MFAVTQEGLELVEGTGHEQHLLATLQDQGAGWVIMEISEETKRRAGLGGNSSVSPAVKEPISASRLLTATTRPTQGIHVCHSQPHGVIKCHLLLVACTQGYIQCAMQLVVQGMYVLQRLLRKRTPRQLHYSPNDLNNFSGFAVFAKKSNQYFICRKMLSKPFSSNPILRLEKDF
jgi:hypothetical protein